MRKCQVVRDLVRASREIRSGVGDAGQDVVLRREDGDDHMRTGYGAVLRFAGSPVPIATERLEFLMQHARNPACGGNRAKAAAAVSESPARRSINDFVAHRRLPP